MRFEKTFALENLGDEFRLWTQWIRPHLAVPANLLTICEYGATETLNNAIDHSHGTQLRLCCEQDDRSVRLGIVDDGIGLFACLRSHFDLDSDLHALIELTKGKLTVAPDAHSGEGLFFASKMFDRFTIEAGELEAVFAEDQCAVRLCAARSGTRISMEIAIDSPRQAECVFNHYCDAEEFSFCKTRFLLSLAAFEDRLVSRSQAKRVAARLENFSEVELDFAGVDHIGQAFADELLRVWPLRHPQTRLIVTHANATVQRMIGHIQSRTDLPQP